MKSVLFLSGIPLDVPTEPSLRRMIRSLPKRQSCLKIFTPNVKMLWQARQNPQSAELLKKADYLLPDGFGVFLASRLCGTPLPCRTTGIDFAERLLRYGSTHPMRVYFLGGKPGIAERAAARMKRQFPNLRIAGTHHGYFEKSGTDNERILRRIRAAYPDVLLVAFGFPAQVRWIAEYADSIDGLKTAVGVGGSFDVWSGTVPRAPKILQRAGLEWLWRTVREPRRIKDWGCFPKFLHSAVRSRRAATSAKTTAKTHQNR